MLAPYGNRDHHDTGLHALDSYDLGPANESLIDRQVRIGRPSWRTVSPSSVSEEPALVVTSDRAYELGDASKEDGAGSFVNAVCNHRSATDDDDDRDQ
jgi:hypothetical protein